MTSRVSGRRLARSRSTSSAQPSASCSSWRRDVGAGRPGDLVQALVAGPGDDRVVAGPEHDVGEAEDRLLGAGEHEHVVRLDRLVQRWRSRGGGAGGRSTPCSRAGARPTAPGSRRRRGRAARPSGSPRRPTRTAGARPRTPSGRRSVRARTRRSASLDDGGPRRPPSPILGTMAGPIVIVGSPTALGGHFAGMERTPGELRRLGLEAAPPGAARPRDGRPARRRRRRQRPRLGTRRRSAGEEPRADRGLPAAAGRTGCRGARTGRERHASAGDRRRLHDPRRGTGRDPPRAARAAGSASPGSTPTATSTRPTARRRATSGGCRSR